MTDIQRGSVLKRISALLLDLILLACISVGAIYLVSKIVNYDSHIDNLQAKYQYYEETYDVRFNITQEELDNLTEEERAHYDEVEEIIKADTEFTKEYNLVINLTLIMVTIGLLVSILITDFVIPLLFKNGQTVGKKVFGLCLVKKNSVRMKNIQLFIRTLLGKFAVELMIPIYIIIMFYFGLMGILGLIILAGLGVAQLLLLIFTQYRTVIHDLLSQTVVADMSSQMIFDTEEDLIEFVKKNHEKTVNNSIYK